MRFNRGCLRDDGVIGLISHSSNSSALRFSFHLGLIGLVVDFLNGVARKYQCVNGFPNGIFDLLNLLLEDLLIWLVLLSVSLVLSISIISVFSWFS